jgi:hypothetical protein
MSDFFKPSLVAKHHGGIVRHIIVGQRENIESTTSELVHLIHMSHNIKNKRLLQMRVNEFCFRHPMFTQIVTIFRDSHIQYQHD